MNPPPYNAWTWGELLPPGTEIPIGLQNNKNDIMKSDAKKTQRFSL